MIDQIIQEEFTQDYHFKGGRGLKDMNTLLRDMHAKKFDLPIATQDLTYKAGNLYFDHDGHEYELSPTDNFKRQISDSLGIPVKYYRKMETEGQLDLLDGNVNAWLATKDKRTNFVRAYVEAEKREGVARAFLSGRYKVIDNLDVLGFVLDSLQRKMRENPNFKPEIDSCSLNSDNFYMRMYFPELKANAEELLKNYRRPDDGSQTNRINPDDGNLYVYTGLIIGNGETGGRSFFVEPVGYTPSCMNMEIFHEEGIRKFHTGSKLEQGIRYSAQTRKLDHELMKSKIGDSLDQFLQPQFLEQQVMKLVNDDTALAHPQQAIEGVCKQLSFSEGTMDALVDSFFSSGQRTTHGLKQAMTWHAQSLGVEARYEMEKAAAKLNAKQIKRYDLAKA